MMLIDSSVWINIGRGIATDSTRFVHDRDDRDEIATAGIIYQEVLQGARSVASYERIRQQFWSMLVLEPREMSTYEIAARLFRKAYDRGLTIRKSNDCLIAALALENGALLVHNDRDFVALSQVEPSLLVFPGRPH